MNEIATTARPRQDIIGHPERLPPVRLTLPEVPAPAPRPRTGGATFLGFASIAIFLGVFAAWSILAPLSEAAIAPGMIKVEGTRRTIQHLEGGIVREILVRDGDRVTAGQVIARLRDDEALARVREALAAARERRDAALAAAEARRQTRLRLARQGRASAALAAAWAALPDELERRWRDPAARAAWLAHVVARAARELPADAPWTLRHAPGATTGELAGATAAAPVAVDCVADPSLRAGLRIARGGNVLDASLDGLLADRDAVAAAVLRAMEAAP